MLLKKDHCILWLSTFRTWPHGSFLFDILVSNQRLPCETPISLEKAAWWMMLFAEYAEYWSHIQVMSFFKKGYVLLKASRCQFQGGTREAGSGCHPWRFRGIHVLGWKVGESDLPSLTYLNSKFAPEGFPGLPKRRGIHLKTTFNL